MVRTPPEQTLIVGWDSEYNTAEDHYVPISDQLYCLHCDRSYFLPHVDHRISVQELFTQYFIEHPEHADIRLVCHYDKAELMGLGEGSQILFEEDANFVAVQKGLFGEFKKTILGVERTFHLSDTYLLFPAPLETLGDLIGIPKLASHQYRERGEMLAWYYEDREEFERYAVRDAEITAKAYQAIGDKLNQYGLPMRNTVGSVYENFAAPQIKKADYASLGYKLNKRWDPQRKFHREYLEPRGTAQDFAKSYFGGRNELFGRGRFPGEVFDYDLVSAYGSVMESLPHWDFDTVHSVWDPHQLYNYLSETPTALGQFRITFRFHDSVEYPTLLVPIDGNLIFLLQGETVCTAQEFLVSYPMLESCQVHGRYFNPKGPGAIADITKSLVQKRREARAKGDKFSDALLKIVINSGYGKTDQGLRHKRSTDLENSTKDRVVTSEIPPSKITNPAIASFITGFVRGVIGELLNYLHDHGVQVLCTTTDGFTTMGQIPEEATLGVGPLSRWLYQQTGKPILELKHQGLVFTGIKTRVYAMSFGKTDQLLASVAGVNGKGCGETLQLKSLWMTREITNLYQFKNTTYKSERVPTLRDWILRDTPPGNITEFKAFNFDYDFKRRPDLDTAHDQGFVGTFLTRPWLSVEDFFRWRKAYQNYGRGKRDARGRQTHLMNKLVNTRQLSDFVRYVQLTNVFANEDQALRIRTNGALRLAANIAYQKLEGLGFKKSPNCWELIRRPAATGR
jgi:hypothetical protein